LLRKYPLLLACIVIFSSSLFIANPAAASSKITGTFVDVTYDEVQLDKKVTEKRLKNIIIKNAKGQKTTLTIDKYAKLSVDTIPTTIDAFKLGMDVEVDVELQRVKALRGKTHTQPGKIAHRDKIVIGTVNRIDPNGEFLSVRLDDGKTKTYYLTNATAVLKGTTLKDLSVLYEGDRVKLIFSEYDTNSIDSIEVIEQGIKVDALYKGKIQRVEPTSSKLIVSNEMMFLDWRWQANAPKSNSSYTYSAKTPIYVGNEQIRPDRLRYYANHDVYFVTVSQFGKQVIEKMVIKKTNERTFYEPMTYVNTSSKTIRLKNAGSISYHDGTILIRNGRLVDPYSLLSSGSAFIATEGIRQSEFANVVHITNDGFQSANLTDHAIYFGQISTANLYTLSLSNAMKLSKNNYWQNEKNPSFSFSNDTVAVRDAGGSTLKVIPQQNELNDFRGRYGYFYVANGHIVATHLLESTFKMANIVSVGRIEGITQLSPAIIRIRNVSQWQYGVWKEAGYISSMNIEQATIIKDGKVITAKDLRVNDRLYLIHESHVKGRILLVN